SGVRRVDADPFTALQRALARYRTDTLPGLPPFQGGAAGYFGYELGQHLETLPQAPYDDLALPDLCVGFYDWVLAWDPAAGRAGARARAAADVACAGHRGRRIDVLPRRVPGRGRPRARVHPRGGHLPGEPVAAAPGTVRGVSVRALSRGAAAEPRAVRRLL